MSTKTMPGPFDGLERSAPDEPIFTLCARDPLAAPLVHDWVERRRKAIREAFANGEITEAKRDLEMIQCREAEDVAIEMIAWRKGELANQAETLASDEPPAGYSGNVSSEEELAARARYETIKRAGTLLSNAVAGINEAGEEVLAEIGMEAERAVLIACRDRVKAVAAHIAPKRASYYPGQPEPEPFPIVGAAAIEAERAQQITREGRDPELDIGRASELAAAAGCYALYADAYPNAGEPPEAWPWDAEWWKPKDWRRDWVRAGALLAAAIDAGDRSSCVMEGV